MCGVCMQSAASPAESDSVVIEMKNCSLPSPLGEDNQPRKTDSA